MSDRRQGPRQAWIWSRVNGSIRQLMVRPSKLTGYWVEDWSHGWQRWPEEALCDSSEEAARQAREHFQGVANAAQAVLVQLD